MGWVAFIEFRLLGARGRERSSFAAKEFRQEEGSDDCDGVICQLFVVSQIYMYSKIILTRCHPHHGACITLAKPIASRKSHNPFI